MYNKRIPQNQAGLTFIELLIALALSSILMAGVFQIFEANRSTLALTESMSQVQEAGRFSLEVLSRDIRMAGYGGCINSDTGIDNFLDEDDAEYDPERHQFTTGITVIDSYDPLVDPASYGGITPITGGDVFVTSGAVATDLLVSKTPAANAATILVHGPENQMDMLKEGEVIMVTDCDRAAIFAISNTVAGKSVSVVHNKNVNGGPDNTDSSLGYSYESGSSVLMMTNAVYFIAPSTWTGSNSLYRYSSIEGGAAVELMPFIDNLVFSYGVDITDDGYVDRYVTGDKLNALAYDLAYDDTYQSTYDAQIAAGASEDDAKAAAEVAADNAGKAAAAGSTPTDYLVSVRVEIVTTSQKGVGAKPLDGYPDDGKLRKRFSRVIHVRNAGIGNDA